MTHRIAFRIVLVLFTLGLGASIASSQSLAELAKKEKERRKGLDKAGARVVTDVELRNVKGPVTSVTGTTTTAADATNEDDASESAGDETAPEDPARTQSYWRDRLQPIDERITSLEERLRSPELTQNPLGATERQRVERDLQTAQAQRQNIVEEGRRQGVPPGWLR